jgi:hypothetical protein
MLKDAKQKVERTSAKHRSRGLTMGTPMSRLAVAAKEETRTPKTNEESTSPKNIVRRETGQEMRRSRVLALASHFEGVANFQERGISHESIQDFRFVTCLVRHSSDVHQTEREIARRRIGAWIKLLWRIDEEHFHGLYNEV